MRTPSRSACATWLWAVVAFAPLWLSPSLVRAEESTGVEARASAREPDQGASGSAREPPEDVRFVIPPAPAKADPRLAVEVHASFALPLNNRSVCPRGVGCVLKRGGGLGGSVERRKPTGFGVFGSYDVWFLDSDSVYELGVQQALHAGLRYTMPTEVVFHPLFQVSLGLMGYGDTFRIATIGALAQVFAGAEVELSETFGLRAGFGLRIFTHSRFRTERDSIVRGEDGTFTESIFLEMGLTVM